MIINPNTNPFATIDPVTGKPVYDWMAKSQGNTEQKFQGLMGNDTGADTDFFNGNDVNVSDASTQRAMDSLASSGKGALSKAALNGIASATMGGSITDGVTGGLTGLMSAPANAAYSAMGVNKDNGWLGSVISKIPGVVGMVAGASTPVGLGLGLLGAPLADGFMDFSGLRKNDAPRDELEDVRGEIQGRGDYADAMPNVKDTSLLDSLQNFGKAAEQARKQSMVSNPDLQETNNIQAAAYQELQDLISGASKSYGGISTGYNSSGNTTWGGSSGYSNTRSDGSPSMGGGNSSGGSSKNSGSYGGDSSHGTQGW